MDGEAFDDYVWMISEVDGILLRHPKVLVVDYDRGLIKAISEKCPGTAIIICRFHIANNIITHCRRNFTNSSEKTWKLFMDHWKNIVHAPTESVFMKLEVALYNCGMFYFQHSHCN